MLFRSKGQGDLLDEAQRTMLTARYRVPEPRLSLGRRLIGLASASLDVSDGLMADLGHISEASHVRIAVEAEKVPLSPAGRVFWGKAVGQAATAGDDYEIAFTAPVSMRTAIAAAAREASVPVHEIGRVEAGEGVRLLDKDGNSIPLGHSGYTHF